ncbi:MAG: heme-binding protein [Pirellulales bacterium]|nr:heme-binding protein [Pirellulales bacterium]
MFTTKLFPIGIVILSATTAMIFSVFAMRAKADDKDFRPIVEAKMPKGFPQYTAVGDVQIKQYPAYRKAEADVKSGRAFWKLLMHIKKNDIAMTAPVEMAYSNSNSNSQEPRESKMAFLYGSADMGQPGSGKAVKVVDVAPMMVISTGVRGPRTTKSVAAARERLQDWLDVNKDLYSAAGELRVMAYNSPFVPRSRNYFEVEIPIRLLETDELSVKGI